MLAFLLLLLSQGPTPAPITPPPPPAAEVSIKLPEEVKCFLGEGTIIKAQTACKDVRFFAMRPNEVWVSPYGKMADVSEAIVVGGKAGTVYLGVVGTKPDGKLTEVHTVALLFLEKTKPDDNPTPDNPKPPTPKPPTPGPVPEPTSDPLYQVFLSALGGLQEPGQGANLVKLAKAWEAAPGLIPGNPTVGQWSAAVRAEIKNQGVPLGALLAIRQRVSDEVAGQLGEDPNAALTGDLATKAATLSKRLSGIFKRMGETNGQ